MSSQSLDNKTQRHLLLIFRKHLKLVNSGYWFLYTFLEVWGLKLCMFTRVVYLVEREYLVVGASVVSVVGLSSIFGKLAGGYLSDKVEREKVFIAGNIILIAGIFILYFAGESFGAVGLYFCYLFGNRLLVYCSNSPSYNK